MGLWEQAKVTVDADVKAALALSLAEATRRRHREAAAPHLVWALLASPSVTPVLAAMHVAAADARAAVAATLDALPRTRWLSFRPPTPTYQQALARAIVHATAAQRSEVTAPHLLAHLVDDDDAAALRARLAEHGFSRLALRQVIAHGTTEAPPPPTEGFVSVVFCDDPFTTMEMVVEILRDVFDVTADAEKVMLRVHRTGRAVVAAMDAERAKAKIDEAHARAHAAGMPLRVLGEAIVPADQRR